MKWNRKWKIPYKVLERRILCFSSYLHEFYVNFMFIWIYKNRKLKVKLWWVVAGEGKKREFCPVYSDLKGFFNIFVLSQCIVYWINFQNIHTFTYQKTLLLHTLFCLFFKSSEAFSVSLRSLLDSQVSYDKLVVQVYFRSCIG